MLDVDPATDCRGVIENVTQERRGLDLLQTLPRIDTQRIGFVGWSNGAHLLGGVMAGVERRVKAYALIGMARPTSNYRGLMEDATPTGRAWDRVPAQLALWDPVTYLGYNRGSAFLFINGESDSNAMQDAKAFVAAAPRPKTWKVYDGGHSPTPPQASTYSSGCRRTSEGRRRRRRRDRQTPPRDHAGCVFIAGAPSQHHADIHHEP